MMKAPKGGQRSYGGCFLGVSVVEAADTVTLERGYGEFAKEAKVLGPE